jgi:hypothetical protein
MADIGATQMLAPDRRLVIGLRSLLVSLLWRLGHSTRTKPILDAQGPEKLRFNRTAGRSFGLLYSDLLSVNLIETVHVRMSRAFTRLFHPVGLSRQVSPDQGGVEDCERGQVGGDAASRDDLFSSDR